ncbi:MAG: hypothetical protein A3B38_04120 [Candidatus Levybacteria bacterium RIFCSPLOWO2_01_FULL_36_13]|nr:MAG: hypothetical protein A2684_01045 [Candidatus Levybacteria bacterium RIFCSPHIGHO2_01_FULL_36_15b]OGH34312.1 MAG: hypothetical protein A3B38_04120 [Candidatus Levybacteria bacterium RIFCSPLOWO2_01_FULL_36_13]
MNTKVVGAIVVLVLLLGIGGFLVLGQNKQANQTATNITPTTVQNEKSTTDIWGILSKGTNQKCDFSYMTSDSSSTGTFYFSGKKMRGDITSKNEGKTSVFYLIRDGDTNYMWGTDLEAGFKMTLKEEDLKTNQQFVQYFNSDQKVDYKCTPWLVDASKFTPPSNIKFTDLSSFTLPKSGAGASCSTCNYLSGDDKASCLQQLNCPSE